MYLKRLDISGFKSFPDPTTVLFDRGVTVVVGPNGCGKTNILDGIRWVLGEQRPRLLRGGRMEEVIFSGTRQRPPLNLAEITLTVDNHAGRLAVPYTEIAVTRRLFRSGESEYLLNHAPCRLKDITALFADTGIGSHSYSVIGQGMIDSLLSDNPEDRRFLFEEAAGISKYKARRKEALHKLEATEHDLLRVQDIRREVDQRVGTLRVQVHRARRYKKIADELAGIEWEQLIGEYRLRREELAQVLGEYHQAETAVVARETELAHSDAELEAARQELTTVETAATELAESLNRAVTAAHQAETELVRNRERREAVRATIERVTREIAERVARSHEWTAELTALDGAMQLLGVHQHDHGAALAGAEREFVEESARLAEVKTTREALAARLRDGERAYGQFQADLTYRGELAATREREKTELSVSVVHVEQEQSSVAVSLEQSRALKTQLSDCLQETAARLGETDRELTVLQEDVATVAAQITQGEKETAALQAQADTFAGIVARGEGLGRGSEAVLQRKDRFAGAVEGWVQRISTPAEKRPALEAALTTWLGSLWCETPEVATEVRQLLQGTDAGRAWIWDPSLPRAQPGERPVITDPGFRGWLLDDCEVEPAMRPMAEALLQSAVLADTAEAARRIFVMLEGQYGVVSPDGTAYMPPGLICAGQVGATVVGRSRQLTRLQEDIDVRNGHLALLRESHATMAARVAELQTSAAGLREEKERLNAERSAAEVELSRAQAMASELDRHQRELQERLNKVEADLADARQRQQAAAQGQQDWEHQHRELVDSLAQADRQLEDQETRHRAALNRLNEVRVEGIELAGRIERLTEEHKRKSELAEQNTQTIVERIRERDEADVELARLGEDIARQETSWANQLVEKDSLTQRRNSTLSVLDEKREVFAAREKHVRLRRKERDEAETTRHKWEMKRAEVSATVDHIVRRAVDRFGKTQSELEAATPTTAAGRTVGDEDIAALRARLERIGPVNLLALEEYERERERLEFLTTQIDDLERAKSAVRQTISELNRTAGERFLATFESARLHFQGVFTELFQGGEADVRLMDPENPLESPIEIFARPRGKKALGILHLSGGERALTAIAMLFALYLVKPSPFCILDEVDAPLDDANTGRFLRLVERFKTNTQFAVITHNKLTMESADNLYGVTMEQPGVSRLVSVRLNPNVPEGEDLFRTVDSERVEVTAGGEEQALN